MKIFLGIEIPEEIKHSLSQITSPIRIRAKGWEHPDDYHLTLLFIGNVENERLDEIKARMDNICFPVFSLQLDEWTFFNRRILYIALKPSEQLLHLKKLIDEKFPEWIKSHQKNFIPHITVKRWQRYEYDELVKLIKENPVPFEKFLVTHLTLFESQKDEEQRKYHSLWRSSLQK